MFQPNTDYDMSATAADEGSDDLIFEWNFASGNFNDENDNSDLHYSLLGTYPFEASDDSVANIAEPGVELLSLTVTDDDGGSTMVDTLAIVPGTADQTKRDGWWKHQFTGNGNPQIPSELAQAYLDIVGLVSSVFFEVVALTNAGDTEAVLSANASDKRMMAKRDLLVAWLHFVSGAIAYDSPVNGTVFIDVMFEAEGIIKNNPATQKELQGASKLLQRTRTYVVLVVP